MLLQKKDNEGFGFVLRGAKGEPLLENLPDNVVLFCFLIITKHAQSYTRFVSNSNTSSPIQLPNSDCGRLGLLMVIPFVVSNAAQTPIEEFTPTPAFPALQYLESVDEGGVAWRAGLRMGDFLIEVEYILP